MQFNSFAFGIFLTVVFLIYWFVLNRNLKLQNLFILAASYFFYAWWDWRFLSLIIFSSFTDYLIGIGLSLHKTQSTRKLLLFLSIFVNIGLLGIFKYFNFFIDSFVQAFSLNGEITSRFGISLVLPVGISFYTFQTLSYTIDVYRRRISHTKDIIAFFAFVGFFPQLVAGPIERASNLLPQFTENRKFDYQEATDGLRQILWGLFKKVVIADNCALFVNDIFTNYTSFPGTTLFLGGLFFAFQIYGDFSGYSDIAIGTARLFGFSLMRNFAYPYFSRDIAEFWRRWHISLTTWFKDYLYIPLGGSRVTSWLKIRNILLVFIISGLWHGANWTFIVWGILNALYFLPLLLSQSHRKNLDNPAKGKWIPSLSEFVRIAITFLLTVFAWIVFRAENIHHALNYYMKMFSSFGLIIPDSSAHVLPYTTFFILILIISEWMQRTKNHALEFNQSEVPTIVRWSIYCFLTISILAFRGNQQEFIYFQF